MTINLKTKNNYNAGCLIYFPPRDKSTFLKPLTTNRRQKGTNKTYRVYRQINGFYRLGILKFCNREYDINE